MLNYISLDYGNAAKYNTIHIHTLTDKKKTFLNSDGAARNKKGNCHRNPEAIKRNFQNSTFKLIYLRSAQFKLHHSEISGIGLDTTICCFNLRAQSSE